MTVSGVELSAEWNWIDLCFVAAELEAVEAV